MDSPKFYNALRAAGFKGVSVGVLQILPGANTIELRKIEYQLINHYNSDLNILREDIAKGNIRTGTEIPVILVNIFT